MNKRWWKTPKKDSEDLWRAIRRSINGCNSARSNRLIKRYRLEWLYERDRLIETYGVQGASMLGDPNCEWIDENVSSLPSPKYRACGG